MRAVTTSADRRHAATWAPLLMIALLGLVAMLPVLANRFAGDAVPLIVRNDRVHGLGDLPMRLFETWWPQVTLGSQGHDYRPLTAIGFALQWVVGVGSPFIYHLTSLLLHLLASALVFAVGRRFLAAGPAALAAALFAVHPVHVEAVASAVGQGELLGTVLLLVAVTAYADGIVRGLTSTRLALVVAGTGLACLAVGQAVIAPLLLAGLTPFLQPRQSRRAAREDASRALVATASVVVLYLAVRHTVVGTLLADAPHPAWSDTPASLRVMTMLAALPVGLRLLFWPAHLQADYSPQEIDLAGGFGPPQVIGLMVVIGCLLLAWWAVRRARPVAAGLIWIALCVLPTSNLFAPTGAVLSETSLFLPSVGACLAAGGVAAWLGQSRLGAMRGLREAVGALLLLVLALGASMSARRTPVWYDTSSLNSQTVLDAPLSYVAWRNWGEELVLQGRDNEAAGAMLRSLSLFDRDPAVYDDLATILRRQGRCDRAVPLYQVALVFDPGRYGTAVRLIGCLAAAGEFAAAREEIRHLSERGRPEFVGLEALVKAAEADSTGRRDSTPPTP